MKFLKWMFIIIGVIALLAGGGLAFYDAGDWTPLFRADKGKLVGAPVTDITTVDEMTVYDVELSNDKGRHVMCRVSIPAAAGKRHTWPAVVLLAGTETGRKAVDRLPPQKNMMVIALDYPEALKLDFSNEVATFKSVWEMREAAMQMVANVLLAGDFVAAQQMVNPERVALAGIGPGALICAAAAAADNQNQFTYVALLQTGAGIGGLIEANASRLKLPVPAVTAGHIGEWLFKPLEPGRYVSHIAPRPLTILNGKTDSWMPANAAQKLFDKAREPKKLIWLKGERASADDRSLLQDLANRVLIQLPVAAKSSALGLSTDMMGR
ncbi:MAG: hypothetical protein NT105_10155 [Verrucomicrobia bacterium]|nr:hypothetical protein [Verrucomicrobiota bacterium]